MKNGKAEDISIRSMYNHEHNTNRRMRTRTMKKRGEENIAMRSMQKTVMHRNNKINQKNNKKQMGGQINDHFSLQKITQPKQI
jgi:hypothetical protein